MNPFSRAHTEEFESKGPAINEPPAATQEFELSVVEKGGEYTGLVCIHEMDADVSTADECLLVADRDVAVALTEVR